MNFDCFSILLYFREGAAVTLLLKLLILKKALNPFNGVTPHLLSEAINPSSSRCSVAQMFWCSGVQLLRCLVV